MKKWPLVTTLVGLIMVLAPLGCDNSESGRTAAKPDGQEITILFVPKLTGNAFFEAANAGAQAYAAKHGFKVEYKGHPEADVNNQVAIIKEAIQNKVKALSISSLDATVLDGVLKEAMAAGIKVTTWDSDVSGDARSIMVSQGTPDQLGRMLVEMGAKSLISRGRNPTDDVIKYVWHYSQASVTDQNSWRAAGERYIRATYPKWLNVAPENYYSEQNAVRAVETGRAILANHPDIDLIICNDSTALPGQAQAAADLGLSARDVTITGFASPRAVRDYCEAGIVERWGLWDCQVQGALACYLAWHLASGHQLSVGDRVDVPDIGLVEVMPNTVLDPEAYTSPRSGVVLLPHRTEFTADNADNYDF
ncbi:substrate-binding domain-containing protein [Deltaproteobacteria bacterium OttesenSCG-928-M10]|nr:substrate-binding domain-containing protein [Deltaproteobacteria bacterium OttesenSCG-928-M10]